MARNHSSASVAQNQPTDTTSQLIPLHSFLPANSRVHSLRIAHSGVSMYHYNPAIALQELQEEALLPHPVKLRDMILRTEHGPEEAQRLNHDFQDYLTRFGELQKLACGILEKVAAAKSKHA